MNHKTIIFVHGMFQNSKSWEHWVKFFERRGHRCINESWPYHEGEPAELRSNIPSGLGKLHLQAVLDKYVLIANKYPDSILIGHSVGGLIVQSLINDGKGCAGIAITSVAPNRMMTMDWSFFKNAAAIANPLKGDEPILMTPNMFHESFANALNKDESAAEYQKTAVNDSRNMLRDCMLHEGHVDLDKPHAPLLFVAGDIDQIIPSDLNKKNAEAYTDKNSHVDFKEFKDRGHYICGQPDWEEVASYVSHWMDARGLRMENDRRSTIHSSILTDPLIPESTDR